MTTIQTYGKSTPIPNGDHVYFEREEDARTNRRMYIDNGHAVSLIAGEGDGYGFDVYDLWTEREAWGLDDPDADAKLHRGEFEAPEADPAEADPAEAEPAMPFWVKIKAYAPSSGTCPIHGAGCEAWA